MTKERMSKRYRVMSYNSFGDDVVVFRGVWIKAILITFWRKITGRPWTEMIEEL